MEDARGMSKISVTVVEGKCQGGYHKIEDAWQIDYEDAKTPEGMCLGAFGSIFPYVMILLGDGKFRWEETKTKTRISCADPKGIVLEIEKIEDE